MVGVDEWLSAFEYLWVPYDSGHRNRLKQKCNLLWFGAKVSQNFLKQISNLNLNESNIEHINY